MANRPTGGVTPYLTIRDRRGREAVGWYGAAFGAEALEVGEAEDGERLIHAGLLVNGAHVMLSDDFPEHGGPARPEPAGTTLHLQVDDADAWFDRAVASGAEATMPLADQFWGDRYGRLRDPFGHEWSIGGPVRG